MIGRNRTNMPTAQTPGTVATQEPTPHLPATAEPIHSCPMHPEVQQDHPGDCPKCGMAMAHRIEDMPRYRDDLQMMHTPSSAGEFSGAV